MVGLRLGSFRIFWSSTGPPRGEIGFVSIFWGATGPLRVKLGSFRNFWSSTGPPRVELGSFRVNRGRRDTWYAGIGFVSSKRWWCEAGGRVNWVRFVYLGRGPGWDWVRFDFLGCGAVDWVRFV